MSNRTTLLREVFDLAHDPEIFDQETGKLSDSYYLKTVAVPTDDVNIIVERAKANPKLQELADAITEQLFEEGFGYSDIHTIFALAGTTSLPRRIVRERPEQTQSLITALTSVGMFHHLAADVVESHEQDIQTALSAEPEMDQVAAELASRGYSEVQPGVWMRGEQE